ncbi:hypothetical protein HY637_01460 [Candidatus Woesearchaeota archaeon]|nr:hypothetical protein [Candidatus Woesearchaeota archaeon]
MAKNKRGEHFSFALLVVVFSMAIFSIAFLSEDSNLTGLAVYEQDATYVNQNLLVYDNVNSLRTLASGNYYLDTDGVVYWLDDSSKPPIAKLSYISESQKNRKIHIDNEGNLGYLLD